MLSFLDYPPLSYFRFSVLFCTMGKDIGHFNKNNRSELSTPTLEKPVLSSSSPHTSSARNSTQTYISFRLDDKHIITNQNKKNISNVDEIQSCVTPWKQNYSVQSTSTTTHLRPLNATLHLASTKLHTTIKLPPNGKEYLFFQISKTNLRTPSVSSTL